MNSWVQIILFQALGTQLAKKIIDWFLGSKTPCPPTKSIARCGVFVAPAVLGRRTFGMRFSVNLFFFF